MTIEEICKLLCEDLMNEYAHWHFYIQASTNIRGLNRKEIGEFFLEQAASEMKHVEEFRKMIQGIITRRNFNLKIPNHPSEFVENLTCPKQLLEEALKMEDQVVNNYVLRKQQAESISENSTDADDLADTTYIALFLEDQILDSRGDADEILEMIKNSIDSN